MNKTHLPLRGSKRLIINTTPYRSVQLDQTECGRGYVYKQEV